MAEFRPKKGDIIHAHSAEISARKWTRISEKYHQTRKHNAGSCRAEGNVIIRIAGGYTTAGADAAAKTGGTTTENNTATDKKKNVTKKAGGPKR